MGQVIDRYHLPETLTKEKRQGSLVFTNGCFDLLHVGHLRYLQAAKKMGSQLVLALNDDESVRRLKGQKRPILPAEERAELLAALNCIDYVVVFHEDSPVNLLREMQPDIYVKGGQYTMDNLPEAPVLRELGVDVKFIPMVEGRSTSSIIEKISRV